MSDSAIIGSIGTGVCLIHGPMTGAVTTGSSTVFINNTGVARESDIVLGYCGDAGILQNCNSGVTADGLDKSRVGSTFDGIFNGTLVSGYPKVEID